MMVRRGDGPLARLFDEGPVAGLTDGQLLDRFATCRGRAAEAAFEALVARHGPMVARVARALLRDEHAVEDAFQATFLVLVRRAGSIGERDQLGPWLYGVAHRVARKARAVAGRRRGREGDQAGFDPPARADSAAEARVELVPVLHEEVDRLPAKYRQPVVLCHLQGLTHAEAARELAWPVGTVSVRLARARQLLADRLARRGVTTSAGLLATTLATEATAATLPPTWAHAAAVAALATATGLPLAAGTLTGAAATLARRTSMTMFLSSCKWLALPAAVALATGTGVILVGTTGLGTDPQAPTSPVVTPAPRTETVVKVRRPHLDPNDPLEQALRTAEKANFEKHLDDDQHPLVYDLMTRNVAELAANIEFIQQKHPDAMIQVSIVGGKISLVGSVAGKGQTGPTIPEKKQAAPPAADEGKPIPVEERPGLRPEIPKPEEEKPPIAVPPVVAIGNGHFELGKLPPDYFNLPPADPNDSGSPRPVQVGQTILVEVLEALPGRPISGERVVRADGTISLGFYGDLPVVGLNRDQIKVRLVEKLRHFLTDQILGLLGNRFDENKNVQLMVAIPPLESNRLFVDDQPGPLPRADVKRKSGYPQADAGTGSGPDKLAGAEVGDVMVVEVLQALPGRPIAGERVVRPDGTISLGFYGDVAVLRLTRDQIKVKVIEQLRKYLSDDLLGLRATDPRTKAVEPRAALQSDRVFVDDMVSLDTWKHPTRPAADGKVQVGQIIAVEVLKEPLPGRPITGQRMVSPDGTINLGFYGTLPVAGLTRDQIKVKIIELLRSKFADADLGLVRELNGVAQPVAPADSASVYVDDVIARPGPNMSDEVKRLTERVNDLAKELDKARGVIWHVPERAPREPVAAPAP